MNEQRLLEYEEILFEDLDQIKYPEEEKKLIQLGDQDQNQLSPPLQMAQSGEGPLRIAQAFIELPQPEPRRSRLFDWNEDEKSEESEEEKKEDKKQEKKEEAKLPEKKKNSKPSGFFSFDDQFQDFQLPELNEQKKSGKNEFKLETLFQLAESYVPVQKIEQEQFATHLLKEYLQKNCKFQTILQYSFGLPTKMIQEVITHLEKLATHINDPSYTKIGQYLSFMIIKPIDPLESRFSVKQVKGILEELDCFGFLNLQNELGYYLATTAKLGSVKREFGEAAQFYEFKTEMIDIDVLPIYWNPDDRSSLIRIPSCFEIAVE